MEGIVNQDQIRIHAVLPRTEALGPYRRFGVWVQGCPRRCKGCMTPDARPLDGGYQADISELTDIIASTEDIEGMTISGGEPFEQADAVYRLIKRVREKRDVGIVVYTGYTLDELRAVDDGRRHAIARLLGEIDSLIEGPYVQILDDGLSLRGSANQKAVHLTSRYSEIWDECYGRPGRNVELHMLKNELFLVGIPGPEMLKKWKNLGSAQNTDPK